MQTPSNARHFRRISRRSFVMVDRASGPDESKIIFYTLWEWLFLNFTFDLNIQFYMFYSILQSIFHSIIEAQPCNSIYRPNSSIEFIELMDSLAEIISVQSSSFSPIPRFRSSLKHSHASNLSELQILKVSTEKFQFVPQISSTRRPPNGRENERCKNVAFNLRIHKIVEEFT